MNRTRNARCKQLATILVLSILKPLLLTNAASQTVPTPMAQLARLSREELRDKIMGGWAGQMIGVSYGAPTEFRAQGRLYEEPINWKPEMILNALQQDDLYVEMTFAKVLDSVGLQASSAHFGEAFRTSQYPVWHANAAARKLLNRGIQAPWSGHPKYNFHANDIDFQIEADFIGLMCPGLVQEATGLCDRVGHVMNYGDGVYGGIFVAGMYAMAFLSTDPVQIVRAGLACIPEQSQYAQLITDLLTWYQEEPNDWRKVWRKIVEKWDKDDPCPDGAFSPFNIDAKLNGAFVAMGLLYGNKDFEKTMEIATRCGQDSDCNPATAAGILGTMLGYQAIPERFRASLPSIADKPFAFTDYSFNSIVRSTEQRALKLIEKVGGVVTENEVWIPIQKPSPPPLEQWSPGRPHRFIAATDQAWQWSEGWQIEGKSRRSVSSNQTAMLRFEGQAIAIIGPLTQRGGQAMVILDDNKSDILIDAYVVPNTHDNILWQAYGLKPGLHTLLIKTVDSRDARSAGNEVLIQGAVTYR